MSPELTEKEIQRVIHSVSQDRCWREVCEIMEAEPSLKDGWRSLGYSTQMDIIDRIISALMG